MEAAAAGEARNGVNDINSYSSTQALSGQLSVLLRHTEARLRDMQTLAQLPMDLQRVAAARLDLNQSMLQPHVLQAEIQNLSQSVNQYRVQLAQVQLHQQQFAAQLQQQQQHQQQQQQQQQASDRRAQLQQLQYLQQAQAQAPSAAQQQLPAQHQQLHQQLQRQAASQAAHPQAHAQPQQGFQMHQAPAAMSPGRGQQPHVHLSQLQNRNHQPQNPHHSAIRNFVHQSQPPPGQAHYGSGRLGSLQAAQTSQQYLNHAQVGAFSSGDRFRAVNGNARKKARREDSPEPLRLGGADIKPTRESNRSRKKVNYAEAEAFADITDDDEADEGQRSDEERKQKQKNAVAAFDDTSELDDEVEKVLAHRDAEGIEFDLTDPYANKEFFVKWRHWSYIHCSWDTRETLYQLAGYKRVKNYIKRMEDLDRRRRVLSREEIELIDVERQMEYEMSLQHQIERIVAERVDKNGERRYLCKFAGLPYGENTWETVRDVADHGGKGQIDAYLEREQRIMSQPQSVEMARRMFMSRHRALTQQPAFLRGGELRDYQMESLNWMVYSWLHNTNIILADEMGLGKTVQCASLLGYFSEMLHIFGPFLVVVPLSTVPNWIKEFKKWIPDVNAVVYVGDTKSREVIREFEFFNKRRSDRELKFEALITTYELVLKDSDVLSQIRWNFLVVDEAHRLKNAESALYKELLSWTFKNKLLVTGTPLQNSVKELWALLHFLDSYRFPSCDDFQRKYDLQNPESVSQLHHDLKPHLLRRVIKDVEKSLPPKNERILRVDMTPLQRQYYKWVLTRNFKELNKGGRAQVTLLNIISDLKKCCNHPFLFESAEEEYKGRDETSMIDRLVRTSGKMVLLDKLLTRLKSAGHRVLLFSQMVHMLDIISDYFRMKGWQHQRLDGSTPSQQRHQAMEQFNAEGSADFAFLLSTRAGGLGINLATADTVIIFDSDWNPQNDLQAMSRAHRIGQKSHVNIYRFVTMGSVEQDILERAKRKMVLDHVIIQRMDTSGRTVLEGNKAGKEMFDKGELAAILRFGAANLFEEEKDAKVKEEVTERDQALYNESIDAILARAEVVDQRVQEEVDEKKNELLSAFNVATFQNDQEDEDFWNSLITDEHRASLPENSRKKKSAAGEGDDGELAPRGGRGRGGPKDPASKGRKSRNRVPLDATQQVTIEVSAWPPCCDASGAPAEPSTPWTPPEGGLPRRDAGVLLRNVRRFAQVSKIDDICADVGPVLAAAPAEARYALWYGIEGACNTALAAAEAQGLEAKDAQIDFFGNSGKAAEILQQMSAMKVLAAEVPALSDPYELFRLDANTQLPPPKWAGANAWTVTDDSMLLLGCFLYGVGQWDRLAADEGLALAGKLAGAVKDGAKSGDKTWPQGSHMETRVVALLKRIDRVRNPDTAHSRPPRKSVRAKPSGASGSDKKPSRSKRKREASAEEPDEEEQLHMATCQSALQGVLAEMRKLRLLGHSDDIPQSRVLAKTRKYMLAIGDAIAGLAAAKSDGDASDGGPEASELWDFVSEFTENNCAGAKLAELYAKLDSKRAAPEDGADENAGGSAAADGDAATAEAAPAAEVKDEDAKASPSAGAAGDAAAAAPVEAKAEAAAVKDENGTTANGTVPSSAAPSTDGGEGGDAASDAVADEELLTAVGGGGGAGGSGGGGGGSTSKEAAASAQDGAYDPTEGDDDEDAASDADWQGE